MKLAKIVLIVLLSVFALSAHAQDRMMLKDGTELSVKIKKITTNDITYKKFDNPSGPDFIVDRQDVESIKYENGTEEQMGDDEPRRRMDHRMSSMHSRFNRPNNIKYGNNILSIAPIQMTNEGPAGIGLAYERVIDKAAMFSFYLPVAMTFYSDNNNNGNGITDDNTRTFFYTYPGIKIYPAGSKHAVTYSVGPSLALGFGTKYSDVYYQNGYIEESKSVFKGGIMINNGLNIMAGKSFYIGLELGLGIYYTNNDFGYTNNFDDSDPLVQFNFKLGYRF